MPDNIGAMFYYGERPWHQKGTSLAQPANVEEAIQAGDLDWDVALVPLQTVEEPPASVDRRMAVVRLDRPRGGADRVLGVVYPGFRPLQNRAAAELFDTLLGCGGKVYHTGGYLANGQVIWLLARLPAEIKVRGDDVVESYLLFTNSHDGSIAIDIRLTTVRVVCQNTLSLALRDRRAAHVFKHAHQGSYDRLASRAQEFFQFALEANTALGLQFQAMDATPFDKSMFENYLSSLLPLPRPPTVGQSSRRASAAYEARVRAIHDLRSGVSDVYSRGVSNGFSLPPAEATLWGALNAVTAFVDHCQKTSGDVYAHILFGKGAQLKRNAYSLAMSHLPDRQQLRLFE